MVREEVEQRIRYLVQHGGLYEGITRRCRHSPGWLRRRCSYSAVALVIGICIGWRFL